MPSSAIAVLVFDLAGVRCALPAAAVVEVLPVPRLTLPPGCPAAIAGFLTLSGRPLPVLATGVILGLPATAADRLYGHVVVLRSGSALGLLVDRAADVVTVWREAISPAEGADGLAACVTGSFASVGRTVHLIDPDRLLAARERAVVADVTAREAARLAAFGMAAR